MNQGHLYNKINNTTIVLSGESAPKVGAKVMDNRKNIVGSVIDIIGPTKSPYVIVKLKRGDGPRNTLYWR